MGEPGTDVVKWTPDMAAAGPRGKFTEELREMYLGLLRVGHGRYAAARMVGVNPATVERFSRGAGDWWRDEVQLAEEEADEPVENVLRAAAAAGEPWAVALWLRRSRRWRALERAAKGSGDTSVVVGVSAGDGGGVRVGVAAGGVGVDGALAGMLEKLRERREVLGAGAEGGGG